jgi:hypothetical protein
MDSINKSKKAWYKRVWVWIVMVLVLLAIAGAAGGGKQQASQPAKSDKSTTSAQAAGQPAKVAALPQTLLDLNGSGTKQTQKFTAAGDWDLSWSYDCSAFGTQGNFQVYVYDDSGSPSIDNTGINQLGAKGSDVQHYHKGGTYYLTINSDCSWTVNVKG